VRCERCGSETAEPCDSSKAGRLTSFLVLILTGGIDAESPDLESTRFWKNSGPNLPTHWWATALA